MYTTTTKALAEDKIFDLLNPNVPTIIAVTPDSAPHLLRRAASTFVALAVEKPYSREDVLSKLLRPRKSFELDSAS